MTEDLIKTFNISLVVRGTVSERNHEDRHEQARYAYPKSTNIFRCVPVQACLPCQCCRAAPLCPTGVLDLLCGALLG